LVNGQHFLRFIKYVQGSRLTGEDAAVLTTPQPLISPQHLFEADAIERRDPLSSTVLTIANNKGGVAKTTTALNLAFALAEKQQQRVLLVDMEGQSSLTKAFADGAPLDHTLLNHFTRQQPLVEIVRPTAFERIWLLPADERLFLYEPRAERRPETELAFVEAIHSRLLVAPDAKPFDWIIIDTPPTQYFLTRLAIAASHYVLLPATSETQAVYGANRALATTTTMRALTGDGVQVIGGVVTRWRKNVPAEQSLVGLIDILKRNGTNLLATRIREDLHIEKAHQKVYGGKLSNLFHLGQQQGPAAEDYENLMKEVLTYVHRN
jgi:chromosome partitioning protein